MGHTRWATHGEVTIRNCHPIVSSEEKEFVVIHNGIVTNCEQIREKLMREGYGFCSETDTETLAKLGLYFYRELKGSRNESISLSKIVLKIASVIEGASAFVMISKYYPNEVCAFKRGSPLILGIMSYSELDCEVEVLREEEELINDGSSEATLEKRFIISSDVNAILDHSRRVLYLEDEDVLYINSMGQFIFFTDDKYHDKILQKRYQTILDPYLGNVNKGEFEQYMLKEIHEQEQSVINTMRGRINFDTGIVTLGGIKLHVQNIIHSRRIVFISCGTSYNAIIAVRQLFEELVQLPTNVENSSDFLDRPTPIFRDDTCIFVSQSGETADTIQALKKCKDQGALCVGIVNQVGSTISRLTDCGIHINAGPEIAVASTKCYTSQIIVLILLSIQLGQDKISTLNHRTIIVQNLSKLSSLIRHTLSLTPQIKEIARLLHSSHSLLLIGRGYQFSVCLEGALKIKEVAYIHSEGINSGELKHGPLALIDHSTKIIMIATKDSLYDKSFSTLQLILARNANPIVICSQNDSNIIKLVKHTIQVPHTADCLQPIINVIPLQLLTYYIADIKKLNIDRPRNLAKCVTVN